MPCVRKLFSRAENVRHAAQRRDRLQRRYRFGSGGGATERRRAETAAGQDQFARAWENISRIVGKQSVDLREKHLVKLNGSAPRNGAMASTDTKEDQGISAGEERNKLEMITN